LRKFYQILKSLIFVGIIGLIIYFSISLQGYDDPTIEIIELTGCYHLSEDQYSKSSNLDDKESYKQLTLRVVKDRIEKHPYVESAEVKFETTGKVLVTITEKMFDTILIIDGKQFLITEKLQVIPVMLYTRGLDYPVIRNPHESSGIKALEVINKREHPDILTACKVITSFKLINSELYEVLSELDLNSGMGISAYFSTFSYELKLGNEDVIRKVIYFNSWYERIKNNGLGEYLDYVDIRFANHIFVGFPGEDQAWDEQI